MKEILANFFVSVGDALAGVASTACFVWYIDEPECPKSLIK